MLHWATNVVSFSYFIYTGQSLITNNNKIIDWPVINVNKKTTFVGMTVLSCASAP